jgi:sulfatase maturation enzyme AslB (radical SAM superfamily)
MTRLAGSCALIKWPLPMSAPIARIRHRVRRLQRNLRGAREVLRALVSTDHPLLAHLIPIRRCNLACKYCNEFDDFSKPVPLELMFARVDKLADLGTSVITISGGEPLLHPELDAIISRIRLRDMVAGLITNGYLLTADRIAKLNRDRQHHSRRCFQEKLESARQKAATIG